MTWRRIGACQILACHCHRYRSLKFIAGSRLYICYNRWSLSITSGFWCIHLFCINFAYLLLCHLIDLTRIHGKAKHWTFFSSYLYQSDYTSVLLLDFFLTFRRVFVFFFSSSSLWLFVFPHPLVYVFVDGFCRWIVLHCKSCLLIYKVNSRLFFTFSYT